MAFLFLSGKIFSKQLFYVLFAFLSATPSPREWLSLLWGKTWYNSINKDVLKKQKREELLKFFP